MRPRVVCSLSGPYWPPLARLFLLRGGRQLASPSVGRSARPIQGLWGVNIERLLVPLLPALRSGAALAYASAAPEIDFAQGRELPALSTLGAGTRPLLSRTGPWQADADPLRRPSGDSCRAAPFV
ncbi:hypothetical protein NDU88_004202 [Pleurodeles waltl]|uniref:Uncharacterized protein n=1 Tax=Pleurodeles waltl TaxID=8319 RepID=A0AAV7WV51_PLEWA|nr:hypothetical protein NDU88_004202 [Pleurodeles waltl]